MTFALVFICVCCIAIVAILAVMLGNQAASDERLYHIADDLWHIRVSAQEMAAKGGETEEARAAWERQNLAEGPAAEAGERS